MIVSASPCGGRRRATSPYAGRGVWPPESMMTGGPPPDCVAVARIACSRRSASAVSRSERVAKRRTSIFGMAAPLARCARALDDAHFYVELAVTALIVEGERRAGLAGGDTGVRALGGGYRDAIDREQQVPRPEPGLLPGTAHVQIGDDDAPVGQPELLRLRVGNILGHYPDPAADHASVLDDVVQHAADHIDRDRKTDSFDPEALGDHGGVDADQGAARVDQRPAGVAEIDGRIGLDEILERRDPELAPGCGADDAMSHGLRKTERIADGEDDVADPKLIGTAESDDRKIRQVDLEHCEIGVRIDADDLRGCDASVRELHADVAGVGNHMVVRHDVTALVDNDAGAEAALVALLVKRQQVAEEFAEGRRVDALNDLPARIYVDYGGGCALHRGRVRHAHRSARGGLARSGCRQPRRRRLRAGVAADEIRPRRDD